MTPGAPTVAITLTGTLTRNQWRKIMRKFANAIALGLALIASPLFAHEFKVGELEIIHPNSRAMVPGAQVGGGFLKIVNQGKTDDRLV